MDVIENIITNVLKALYRNFWFSVSLASLFMFFYLFAKEYGWKKSISIWISQFKKSRVFRRVFFLALCVSMIFMQTLFNRNMWTNPLSGVMGGWTMTDEEGNLTTDSIENIILMIPFSFFMLLAIKDKFTEKQNIISTTWLGLKYSFIFSLMIEFLQLFLRLGTFQFADIFYNTIGGIVGGIIYYFYTKIFKT